MWWQTVKTGVPALNQALLSFPTLWFKLCWALLGFVKLWYALGALINSWQSAQNFWTVQKNLALLPNVTLYSKLSHDLLRPCRFNQALLRFACRFKAPPKRRWCELSITCTKGGDDIEHILIKKYVTYSVVWNGTAVQYDMWDLNDDIFLGFVRQSYGVVRFHRVARLPQQQICSFSLWFLCDLMKTYDGCKAAARHVRCMYD